MPCYKGFLTQRPSLPHAGVSFPGLKCDLPAPRAPRAAFCSLPGSLWCHRQGGWCLLLSFALTKGPLTGIASLGLCLGYMCTSSHTTHTTQYPHICHIHADPPHMYVPPYTAHAPHGHTLHHMHSTHATQVCTVHTHATYMCAHLPTRTHPEQAWLPI